jgi:predicted Zn-dependent protease
VPSKEQEEAAEAQELAVHGKVTDAYINNVEEGQKVTKHGSYLQNNADDRTCPIPPRKSCSL